MDFRAIKEATGPASNVESESCVEFVTNLAKKVIGYSSTC